MTYLLTFLVVVYLMVFQGHLRVFSIANDTEITFTSWCFGLVTYTTEFVIYAKDYTMFALIPQEELTKKIKDYQVTTSTEEEKTTTDE